MISEHYKFVCVVYVCVEEVIQSETEKNNNNIL